MARKRLNRLDRWLRRREPTKRKGAPRVSDTKQDEKRMDDKHDNRERSSEAQNVPSQRATEKKAGQVSNKDAAPKGRVLSDDQQALSPATEGRDVHFKSKGAKMGCQGDNRLGHVPTCPIDLAGDDPRVETVRDFTVIGYEKGRTFSVPCAIQYLAFRPERIA